jgi:hypothetical protein
MATRPVITSARTANTEARSRFIGELENRERASGILKPGEVAGEYNSARLLQTTLGGQLRPITQDDLRTFRDNVRKLGKQFRGGITAKSVIDLSTKVDRDRANEEIRTAIPMQSVAGRMHFVTNAGPKSDVTRHHVHIEMLGYSAAVSSPGKMPDVVKMLTTGPLKFDCDCGRHTFWFRYIATTGRFNAGRDEPGFPKIRNPKLSGVACKHVLRVMQQINTPLIRIQVEKMIERGRTSLDRKGYAISKAEAQSLAAQQSKQAHWKRNQVESAPEKRDRLVREKKTLATVERAKAQLSTKAKSNAIKAFEMQAKAYMAQGVFTAKQVAAILASLK